MIVEISNSEILSPGKKHVKFMNNLRLSENYPNNGNNAIRCTKLHKLIQYHLTSLTNNVSFSNDINEKKFYNRFILSLKIEKSRDT